MIRNFRAKDLGQVAKIWLDTNVKAHHFIPAQYWQDHFEAVKGMLLQAELYVYEQEESHKILGFIGMDADYIAGIFVCGEEQSKGIGKQLLDFVKRLKPRLRLNVYKKNERAVKFYQREGFTIHREAVDPDTGEEEYAMLWERREAF